MTSPWRRLRLVLVYAGLAFFLVIALFPIVWIAITAFKDEQDRYQMRFPLWFHLPPTLKHFRLLFTQTCFWGALMAAGLLVGLPAALAFNLVIDRFIQGLTGAGDQ